MDECERLECGRARVRRWVEANGWSSSRYWLEEQGVLWEGSRLRLEVGVWEFGGWVRVRRGGDAEWWVDPEVELGEVPGWVVA